MKRLLLATLAALFGVTANAATPAAIYINNSPVTYTNIPPVINSISFLNRSIFEVSTFALPYQAQNVQFWTNTGIMGGNIGFIFERDSDGTSTGKKRRRPVRDSRFTQLPSAVFHNEGSILAGTILAVRATNIVMPGRLDALETAAIRVQATNGYADLSRGGIRVGTSIDPSFNCDSFTVSTNFFADPNITELYWAAGRNNGLATNAQRPLNLTTVGNSNSFSFPNFTLPSPTSPQHQVIQRLGRSIFTNSVVLGGFFGTGCGDSNYAAFVHTTLTSATSSVVNVVFVPTNNSLIASNFTADVRFYPNFFSADVQNTYVPVVEFRSVDFDIVNQRFVTNYVSLVDASAGETNIVLARPFATVNTTVGASAARRPSTYTWIKGRFCSFDFADVANTPYDPGIFYSPLMSTNVVNLIYAASSVQVGQSNSQSITTTTITSPLNGQFLLGVNPGLSDPTNFSGHVSIAAKELNLANARIKSEDYIGIQTDNLVSNALAQLDAPFIDFDVRSTNSDLLISNVAPAFVNRLIGTISAWSGVWDVDSTNTIGDSTNLFRTRFHVLVVDHCLQAAQAVTMHRFKVRAPSAIVHDNIRINSGLLIDARDFTLQTNASLTLPVNSNFAPSNVLDLVNFTNFGSLNLFAGGYFGTFDAGHIPTNAPPKRRKRRNQPPPPGPAPLNNFVNHSLISGSSIMVKATNFQNTGGFQTPARIIGNGGVVLVTASSITVSNAEVLATSDIEFHGNNLSFAGTLMDAGVIGTNGAISVRGAIVIDATNSLGDFESVTTNDWFVTSGFRVPTQPAIMGDFMGSRVYSAAGALVSSRIVWPGEDRGATVNGYFRNLALGRLVLDGRGGNLFRFSAVGETNAIYVDYLELLNDATNYNFAVGVDPNFTIYFANSSPPPEKLDNLAVNSGRLRWVRDFAGPQSSTNITYPNGTTYRFNVGLVRSIDIDSDGDGIPNGLDCTPIEVSGFDSKAPCPGESASSLISVAASKSQRASSAAAVSALASSSDFGLTISLSGAEREVTLSWDAPASSTSTVEFSDALGSATWRTLTNLISGPVNTRVTVKDAAGAPLRVYRVRVDAVNQQ